MSDCFTRVLSLLVCRRRSPLWTTSSPRQRTRSLFRSCNITSHRIRRLPAQFGTLATRDMLDTLRTTLGHLIEGTPEGIIDHIRTYEAAGLDELMIDWFDLEDIQGLQVLAEEILPHVSTKPATLLLETVQATSRRRS